MYKYKNTNNACGIARSSEVGKYTFMSPSTYRYIQVRQLTKIQGVTMLTSQGKDCPHFLLIPYLLMRRSIKKVFSKFFASGKSHV